jgi:hypothetical protein
MKLDWQDLALRMLLVAAGGVAAVLLVLTGHGLAVPALAIGATLGTLVMGVAGPAGS